MTFYTRSKPVKKAKGILRSLKPLVMPAATGLTFYTAYTARAKSLLTAGLITKDSVYDAIMYDLKHLDMTAAVGRLKTKAVPIAVAGGVGVAMKAGKSIAGSKLSPILDITGDAIIGMAAGTLIKTILDPPIPNQPDRSIIEMQRETNTERQIPTYTPIVGGY